MKIKERWEFEQIKDNPDGFKNFILSRFDIDKQIRMYQNKEYPINCSNKTKAMIEIVRDKIFTIVLDKEIQEKLKLTMKTDVDWYVEEFLQDITLDLEIRNIMKVANDASNNKYHYTEKSVYNTLRKCTKSMRYLNFIQFEQIYNLHYRDTKNNKDDNFNVQQTSYHQEQWEHVWCMHYLLSIMFKWMYGKVTNIFKGYNGKLKTNEKFQKTMELLLDNNTDSDWYKAYEDLYELWVSTDHAGTMYINRKENYE